MCAELNLYLNQKVLNYERKHPEPSKILYTNCKRIHRLMIFIHFMLDIMNFKSCRRINLLNGYATLQGITC